MPSFEKDVRKILIEYGCAFHRQGKGDHEIWFSPASGRYFTVDGKIKSCHRANEIFEQAGVEFGLAAERQVLANPFLDRIEIFGL